MSTKTLSLRKLTLASAVALGAGWGVMAQAQESADLDVSATVVASCTIDTAPLAFGEYDPISEADVDGTGTVTVTCTQGSDVDITLGQGDNAVDGSRRLTDDGTNFLTYLLYSDAARTVEWTEDEGGEVDRVGTGEPDELTVYGRIGSGQSGVPEGDYTDTVVATVTF